MKVLAKMWKIWRFSRPGRKLTHDQETVYLQKKIGVQNRLVEIGLVGFE